MRRIFEGTDYLVYHFVPKEPSSETVLFTMNSWAKEPGFAHPPFAFALAQELDIEFVGVVPQNNCWWQKKEFSLALGATIDVLAEKNVAAYGSSMGAYGIINFSNEIGIDRGLALVPQFSIDPALVPFENRWREEAAKLQFDFDLISNETIKGCFDCIYDERHWLDKQHVDLLKPRMPNSRFFSLKDSGHNPAKKLKELGILKEVVMQWIKRGYLPQPLA